MRTHKQHKAFVINNSQKFSWKRFQNKTFSRAEKKRNETFFCVSHPQQHSSRREIEIYEVDAAIVAEMKFNFPHRVPYEA